MELSFIQPNCSECALVVYPDKLDLMQKKFFNKFRKTHLMAETIITTPKGNISIESDKEGIAAIKTQLETLAAWEGRKFKHEEEFDTIRDESYYDMIEEKRI
jgi:hypothetical protein